MATRATDSGTNQSVERAVSVLRALDSGRAELRVSDVAELTGLGSSTTSRLLSTLERLDMVERDPVSNLYRLSLGLLPWLPPPPTATPCTGPPAWCSRASPPAPGSGPTWPYAAVAS